MGKLEYLDQLKRAMLGLAPEVQARTLAYYEQRFVDGQNAHRSEQDVAQELDDPRKIAMTLRASSHAARFGAPAGGVYAAQAANAGGTQAAAPRFDLAANRNPFGFLRMLVSGAGLAIFNLFMVVPAMVFSALLVALYTLALVVYLSGIAVTASGLAGNSDLLLDLPTRYMRIDADDPASRHQIRVQIDDTGIHIHEEDATRTDGEARPASRLRRGAEVVAGNTLHVTTEMDADSRTTQTVIGGGMVLGGITLFLLAMVATRLAALGIRRYIQMNFSLLNGH